MAKHYSTRFHIQRLSPIGGTSMILSFAVPVSHFWSFFACNTIIFSVCFALLLCHLIFPVSLSAFLSTPTQVFLELFVDLFFPTPKTSCLFLSDIPSKYQLHTHAFLIFYLMATLINMNVHSLNFLNK